MTDKEKSKNKVDKVVKSDNALVFISHDAGDAKLAEAFSALLKSVSAGVLKSFRTSDKKGNQGLEYGAEWYPKIIKKIQEASDVVCLLTERSVNKPWILFEAGMAKGNLETPILGVALGISLKDASTGPFAQFQNCGDDEESLTQLVFQLVDRIPNSEPDKDTIKFQVGKFKKSIAEILKTSSKATDKNIEASIKDNSSAKLFEEIKVMFKDLPSRIEGNMLPEFRGRKKHRFRPVIMEEMLHMIENRRVRILVLLSVLRDVMPWLYDAGIETLRVIDSNCSLKEKNQSFAEFHELIEITLIINPIDFNTDDLIMYDKSIPIVMREMQKYIHKK